MSDLFDGRPPSDPERTVRASNAMVLPKRFYKAVGYAADGDGFVLQVDGRSVRTPAKSILRVPKRAIADALVAEWDAQTTFIDPATMPLTRLVNSAIDGVAREPDSVRDEILRYAETDMLCYRAADPERLVAIQDEMWSPLIRWMHERYGARFILVEGIVYNQQNIETRSAVSKAIGKPDSLQLAALSTVTTLTGSTILALALRDRRLTTEEAWAAAHVDEDFEFSLWGEDDEANLRRAARFREMQAAALVLAA
jgi:chaperone required for assembly of F1-ATPase